MQRIVWSVWVFKMQVCSRWIKMDEVQSVHTAQALERMDVLASPALVRTRGNQGYTVTQHHVPTVHTQHSHHMSAPP